MKKTELDYINENKKALFKQNKKIKDNHNKSESSTLKNSSINKQYQGFLGKANSDRTRTNTNQNQYVVETYTSEPTSNSTDCFNNNSSSSNDDCGSND